MGEIQRISRLAQPAGFFTKPYRVQSRDGRPGERRGTSHRPKDAEDVLELSVESESGAESTPVESDSAESGAGLDLEA